MNLAPVQAALVALCDLIQAADRVFNDPSHGPHPHAADQWALIQARGLGRRLPLVFRQPRRGRRVGRIS